MESSIFLDPNEGSTGMLGQSVRTKSSSSQQFVRKERKRRPLTPVEDILSGIVDPQPPRDISIYQDDDDASSQGEAPPLLSTNNKASPEEEEDQHEEALQWTTAASVDRFVERDETTHNMTSKDDLDESNEEASSIARTEQQPQQKEDDFLPLVSSTSSPHVSPTIHKSAITTTTPTTLPCTPESDWKFNLLNLEERESWKQSLSLDVSSPDSSWHDTQATSNEVEDSSLHDTTKATSKEVEDVPNDNEDDDEKPMVRSRDRNNETYETCQTSDDSISIIEKRKKFLFDGAIYQDKADSLAIVSSVESKRQCWLKNELANARNEWQYYRQWLYDTVREVQKVEELIANSHVALVQYTNQLAGLATRTIQTPTSSSLSRRHRQMIAKNLPQEPTELEIVVKESYSNVQEALEQQVPAMTECVREATAFKQRFTQRAEDLAERGERIRMDYDVETADAETREAFCILMDVLNEHEHHNELLRSDRWIAEASYRSFSRNVMVLWKQQRRQLQLVYKEIIRLDQGRKQQQQRLLQTFLPLRKELLKSTHAAFELGIERLHTQAKQMIVEHDALPEHPEALSSSADNAYVKCYRFVDLRSNLGWQKALVVVTLDDELHIFDNYKEEPTLDNVAATLWSKRPYLTINPCLYEISRSGMEIELLRPGRSKLFRKRDDYCVLRLSSEYEASKWYHSLEELTESRGIHC